MPSSIHRTDSVRFFIFLFAVASVIAAAFVALSLYERSALGEYGLGIGKTPIYTPYYVGRMLLAFGFAVLLAGGLYRLSGERSATITRPALSAPQRGAAYVMLAATASGIVLFLADPVLFYELALEDRALEWASALVPLLSSAFFAYAFWRVLRSDTGDASRGLTLTLTALLAAGLFVLGMEEISWMQRVFEIETPAAFAGNQQQEMNLHNMHSIVIGTAHKLAMYVGLIVLPFLVETAPRNPVFSRVEDFLPTRFVLVISAPFAAYNYNAWNLFLTPLVVFLTAVILACYLVAALRRGDRAETQLFVALAAFVVVGQLAFLAFGDQSVRMWDYSEYAELFMAVGFAVYSWQTLQRLLTRFAPPSPRSEPMTQAT